MYGLFIGVLFSRGNVNLESLFIISNIFLGVSISCITFTIHSCGRTDIRMWRFREFIIFVGKSYLIFLLTWILILLGWVYMCLWLKPLISLWLKCFLFLFEMSWLKVLITWFDKFSFILIFLLTNVDSQGRLIKAIHILINAFTFISALDFFITNISINFLSQNLSVRLSNISIIHIWGHSIVIFFHIFLRNSEIGTIVQWRFGSRWIQGVVCILLDVLRLSIVVVASRRVWRHVDLVLGCVALMIHMHAVYFINKTRLNFIILNS